MNLSVGLKGEAGLVTTETDIVDRFTRILSLCPLLYLSGFTAKLVLCIM